MVEPSRFIPGAYATCMCGGVFIFYFFRCAFLTHSKTSMSKFNALYTLMQRNTQTNDKKRYGRRKSSACAVGLLWNRRGGMATCVLDIMVHTCAGVRVGAYKFTNKAFFCNYMRPGAQLVHARTDLLRIQFLQRSPPSLVLHGQHQGIARRGTGPKTSTRFCES